MFYITLRLFSRQTVSTKNADVNHCFPVQILGTQQVICQHHYYKDVSKLLKGRNICVFAFEMTDIGLIFVC